MENAINDVILYTAILNYNIVKERSPIYLFGISDILRFYNNIYKYMNKSFREKIINETLRVYRSGEDIISNFKSIDLVDHHGKRIVIPLNGTIDDAEITNLPYVTHIGVIYRGCPVETPTPIYNIFYCKVLVITSKTNRLIVLSQKQLEKLRNDIINNTTEYVRKKVVATSYGAYKLGLLSHDMLEVIRYLVGLDNVEEFTKSLIVVPETLIVLTHKNSILFKFKSKYTIVFREQQKGAVTYRFYDVEVNESAGKDNVAVDIMFNWKNLYYDDFTDVSLSQLKPIMKIKFKERAEDYTIDELNIITRYFIQPREEVVQLEQYNTPILFYGARGSGKTLVVRLYSINHKSHYVYYDKERRVIIYTDYSDPENPVLIDPRNTSLGQLEKMFIHIITRAGVENKPVVIDDLHYMIDDYLGELADMLLRLVEYASKNGVKIIFVSDRHYGYYYSKGVIRPVTAYLLDKHLIGVYHDNRPLLCDLALYNYAIFPGTGVGKWLSSIVILPLIYKWFKPSSFREYMLIAEKLVERRLMINNRLVNYFRRSRLKTYLLPHIHDKASVQ